MYCPRSGSSAGRSAFHGARSQSRADHRSSAAQHRGGNRLVALTCIQTVTRLWNRAPRSLLQGALFEANFLNKEIKQGPHAQRQIATLFEENGMDFLHVAWIAVFKPRHQPASRDVVLD